MTEKNIPIMPTEAEFAAAFRTSLALCGLSDIAGSDAAVHDFFRLAEMLLAFNAHTNVTAITDIPGLILSHFCDSLTVAAAGVIPEGARAADIGCGGGFPTLPLAIVRPDVTFTAIDSTQKKLRFVGSAAAELGLGNVNPLCVRAEEGAGDPELRGSFDFVTARAVSALPMLAELCLPYLKVGGTFCAMKGPRGEEELADSANALRLLGGRTERVEKITLSLSDSSEPLERMLIIIKKTASTPDKYPRSYGKIKSRPL